METTFALVATFQLYENCAFTDEGFPNAEKPYWKAKGGDERVYAKDLTANQVTEMGKESAEKLIYNNMPQNNDIYQYELLNWKYVELSSELVEKVKHFVVGNVCAYGNNVYWTLVNGSIEAVTELQITEYEASWALSQIYSRENDWEKRFRV